MATYLFDVAELFELRERGLFDVANRNYRTLDSAMKLRIGDEIEFRNPSTPPV